MYKIAVIEDHQSTNDLFKSFIKDTLPDSEVSQFLDLESAITALNEVEFDLVVSDVDLGPGTDEFGGVKIARALNTGLTPLLIVSGSPQHEVQRGVFRALDAWDYLQKPVSASDFSTQVLRAISFRDVAKNPIEADRSTSNESVVPGLQLSPRGRHPIWNGKKVHISIRQTDLVKELASKAGEVVTYEALYEHIVSGKNKENLRVVISEIRQAFKEADTSFDRIKAVALTGYVWNV